MNINICLKLNGFKLIFILFLFICNISSQECQTDKDCSSIALKANPLPLASLGAYACISNQCTYVVKAGEKCTRPQDCAAYTFLKRSNTTSNDLLSELCSSDFCTLESNCDGAWDIQGSPGSINSVKCCGGIGLNQEFNTCPAKGIQNVDVCSTGYSCTFLEGQNFGKCETAAQHYEIWIGVVLVLLGGSLLNFGLNLQKFALNRHDRKLKEKAAAKAIHDKISPKTSPIINPITNIANVENSPTSAPSNPVSNTSTVFANDANPANRLKHTRQRSSADIPPLKRTLSTASVALSAVHTLGNGAVTFKDKVAKLIKYWKSSVINPLYILGLLIYIGASGLNFVALQFAPQSLVGPLGSVSLITNIILAPLMNKEKLGKTDFIGIALIIGGCVMVVFFSGIVQHDYRLCVLYKLFSQTPTIIFLTIIFGLMLIMFCYIKVIEKNLELEEPVTPADLELSSVVTPEPIPAVIEALPPPQIQHNNESIGNNKASPRNSINSQRLQKIRRSLSVKLTHVKKARKCTLFELDHSIFDPIIPTLKNKISRKSKHYKYLLPIAYASLGSLMATLTTLFAKTLINLLSISIFQGDNQFNNWLPWFILLFVAFTAFSQVYWIMLGLRRYDALLQVPVFYVIWTMFDIIGGGVYFDEFREFTPLKYGMFCLGVAIIFTGVAVLAHRMSHIK